MDEIEMDIDTLSDESVIRDSQCLRRVSFHTLTQTCRSVARLQYS